jgi:hypothetical protein
VSAFNNKLFKIPSLLRKEGQSRHPPLYKVERGKEGVSMYEKKELPDRKDVYKEKL